MSSVTRADTYELGELLDPVVHNQEHDDFVAAINDNDSRIGTILTGTQTLSGNKTFSGSTVCTGTLTAQHATGITTNTITERSVGSGVTADGLLIKDGIIRPTVSADPTPTNGDYWYNSTTNFFKGQVAGTTYFFPHLATPTGNGSKLVRVNAGGTGWEYVTASSIMPVSIYNLSSGQTISSAGDLTVAHSLSTTPKFIFAYVQCTGAEGNWSVGDKVPVPIGISMRGTTQAINFSARFDATNIYIRFADDTKPIWINDNTSNASFNCTNGSWQLYLGALA